MASEMIGRVRVAEEKAEQAMLSAKCQADDIIAATDKRISEADATARNQAEIKAGRIVDTAGGTAREKAVKAEQEAVKLGESMKKTAMDKQSEVTKVVLEEILS